jgi:hypothetical protein
MSRYLDLIYVGPEQALPIIVGLILWIGMAGLGALVTGKDRLPEANAIFGWAAISGVFTVVGVQIEKSLFVLAIFAGIAALVGIYRSARTGQALFIPGMWRVLVLALPLLWIAGAMEPSQWDEFSHWLPAPKYLFEFNGFPNKELPFSGPHMLPAYPYGWPFLTYLSALIAGQLILNVTSTLNLFLILAFSTFALRTAQRISGKEVPSSISWPFATAVVLFSTLLNPTFIQKIVLTAYSDASTSVLTGFCLLLGYYFLESLGKRRVVSTWSSAWQLSLVLSLLVNVRQANLVLVVILLITIIILAVRDPEIRLLSFTKHLVFALLPILAVYLSWRYYVAVEFNQVGGAEAKFRPFETWNFAEIPQIFQSMGYVAFKKIGFFGPMIVACYFGFKGLLRFQTPFDRIVVLIAAVFVGYTSFLFLTYVGHFQPRVAVGVVSFWRYSTHNGMVAVAFISIGLVYLFHHRTQMSAVPKWLKTTALLLVVILPFVFSHKLRFDLEPPKPHFTAVAKDIAKTLPEGSKLFVLDPLGTGESHKITYFYLHIFGEGYLSAFQAPTLKKIRMVLDRLADKTFAVIYSEFPGMSEIVGIEIKREKSYLIQKEGNVWKFVRDWQKPANHRN